MTRYPKKGKGAKWTTRELQAIPLDWKGDTLSDGGGLSGEARVSGDAVSVRFKYAFRWADKVAWFQCGTWPVVDLAEIRERRDEAKRQVAAGINPNDRKQAERIENQKAVEATIEQDRQDRIENLTVKDLFDVWVADGVARQDDNAELKRLFNKDVLPCIGDKPLRELADTDILAMLRKMQRRGVIRLVVVAYNDTNQMLAWGEKRQPWRGLLINGNPCDLVDVNKLLPDHYEEERDRTLSPAEIRELRDIFQCTEDDWLKAPDRRATPRPFPHKSQLALWICLGTLCRIGELLMARWEHVDFDEGMWFIPRENVKGGRGKKQEHYVFMSDFTRRQFEALKEITGESEWLFPARNKKGEETHICLKSISKGVGDRQEQFKNRKPLKNRRHDNTLVLAGGANGEWTPHDLRRTGATMMQGLGVSLDVIDRCQNHLLAGRVRRVYLRHDYQTEKTLAWRKLGDRVDAILKADNLLILKTA